MRLGLGLGLGSGSGLGWGEGEGEGEAHLAAHKGAELEELDVVPGVDEVHGGDHAGQAGADDGDLELRLTHDAG